jgi:hypothetical protein
MKKVYKLIKKIELYKTEFDQQHQLFNLDIIKTPINIIFYDTVVEKIMTNQSCIYCDKKAEYKSGNKLLCWYHSTKLL